MSKFDYCCYYGGYDSFAVSKEKYTKEEAIEMAKDEFYLSGHKYLAIGNAWTKHRAGVNEDNEPVVGWWIEYEDTGRNCPAFVFHIANKEEGFKNYEYIFIGDVNE